LDDDSPDYCCTTCGKELKNGDMAYGTILGNIQAESYGFMASDDPYEVVECPACHHKRFED